MEQLTQEELQKLRDISIHYILGVKETGRRIGIACPIHKGRNPNFNLYPNNSYYCFKCGACGQNALDLMRDLNGFQKRMTRPQFLQVARELIHFLG